MLLLHGGSSVYHGGLCVLQHISEPLIQGNFLGGSSTHIDSLYLHALNMLEENPLSQLVAGAAGLYWYSVHWRIYSSNLTLKRKQFLV